MCIHVYTQCSYCCCWWYQVIRYNRLLVVVHQSLGDLLKALKGLVVMSEVLETMFNSIYNNAVPDLWAAKVREQTGFPSVHSTALYMYIYITCTSCVSQVQKSPVSETKPN